MLADDVNQVLERQRERVLEPTGCFVSIVSGDPRSFAVPIVAVAGYKPRQLDAASVRWPSIDTANDFSIATH